MTKTLNHDQVRRIAVAAQGLHLAGGAAPATVTAVLGRLGCVQIDSMSAVRRSHELVLLGRGVSARDEPGPGRSFEGMAHALSLIDVQLWPAFGFRRRQVLANGWRGPEVDMAAVAVVRDRLAGQGRVRLRDFGGMTGTGWERDSPFRWALEWLAATGGAVCAERDRWERVYALPELVLPPDILAAEPGDEECVRELCHRAITALGVASTADVADYFRMRPAVARAGLSSLGLARAEVEGWREPAWLAPDADPAVELDDDAVTPLSPFDSLVWTRDRLVRVFGKDYRLEAYKPAAKRAFGYFALPVLAGGEIAGRVACRRRDGVLVVENTELDPHLPTSILDRAVATLAGWTTSGSAEATL